MERDTASLADMAWLGLDSEHSDSTQAERKAGIRASKGLEQDQIVDCKMRPACGNVQELVVKMMGSKETPNSRLAD